MRNLQSDSEMRNAIANVGAGGGKADRNDRQSTSN